MKRAEALDHAWDQGYEAAKQDEAKRLTARVHVGWYCSLDGRLQRPGSLSETYAWRYGWQPVYVESAGPEKYGVPADVIGPRQH